MKKWNFKRVTGLICLSALVGLLLLAACPLVFAQSNVPGATTWYLAEGSTGVSGTDSFETWVCVSNSGENVATVQLTYMTPEGDTTGPKVIVEPDSATSVDVSQTVPDNWSVSTKVESDEPVAVEREMFWNTGTSITGQPFHQSGHGSIGVTQSATAWYLAEGSTGGDSSGSFETWILVQNPGDSAATINIDYQTETRQVKGPQGEVLAPNSRKSFNVEDAVPGEWSVSTSVTSNKAVIAERAVYWNSPHMKRQAAHDSIGVTTPAKTWYLAEGSTGESPGSRLLAGNFETWILVQNPGETPAIIDINYQTPSGKVEGPQDESLPGHSRKTFKVADKVPNEWSVSTQVVSTENVIAERSVYWNIPFAYYPDGALVNNVPRWCGHDSIGATNPDYNWEIANCRVDLAFDSWILVQNPSSDTDAVINIDYTTPGGIIHGQQNYKIPPNTRESFQVIKTVQDIQNVGATVRSNAPVVVEHSTYWGPAQGEDPQNYRVCGFDTISFPWSSSE